MTHEQEEWLEVVDESGRRVGSATRRQCHANRDLIHQAVHVLVFDSGGRLFLQKRSQRKDIQPGKWDCSVGGHIEPGEAPRQAAVREMHEELGVRPDGLEFACQYLWRCARETELVRTFVTIHDGPFELHGGEIDDGRYWTDEEIEAELGRGVFTPNFEFEFARLQARRRTA